MKIRFRLISIHCLLLMLLVMLSAFNINTSQNESITHTLKPVSDRTVYIAVMDPLALENACSCVLGFAQREYQALAKHLEKKLGVEVQLVFDESIEIAKESIGDLPEIVIGKKSVVEYDAREVGCSINHIAMLSDLKGATTLKGLFIVKSDDKAEKINDLQGRKISFGPEDSDEKRSAAIATLKKNGIEVTGNIIESEACNISAIKILNGDVDAAVISDYAMTLLVGCKTVAKGELKVIGETAPVPFIAVYTTEKLRDNAHEKILQALMDVSKDKELLKKLESRDGFIKVDKDFKKNIVNIPSKLPSEPKFLWKQNMASQSLGGICATNKHVIISDKSADGVNDIWRCFDSQTGKPLWTYQYEAPDKMDYTNAPRARAVIQDGMVYLLGAFGDLHCVELSSGGKIWKCNLVKRFGGEVPTWGFCGTPLIIDEKLIVSTSSTEAAIVALDCKTGRTIWKCPGNEPGYGSFIVGTFGGKKQIIGHDAISLGGWDIKSGKRLWTLKPEYDNDFNVPTPIQVGDKLFVVTENNGARLYAFNGDGTIVKKPVAVNEDFTPDIASPILVDGVIWGTWYGGTICIDPSNELHEVWLADKEPFNDYACFIAGQNNLLIVLKNGMISVVPSRPEKDFKPSTLAVFKAKEDSDPEVWSQPVLIGNKLYLRSESQLVCLLLS